MSQDEPEAASPTAIPEPFTVGLPRPSTEGLHRVTRRVVAALMSVALLAVAMFSVIYLRSHSTDTVRGTYQGGSWKLSVIRDFDGTCMHFTSTGGDDVAGCGFTAIEPSAGGSGPAGSQVEFGPLPEGAVKVAIRPDSGIGAIDIQVHRFSGVLAHGRYFFAIAPVGTVPGTLTYQNASGADVAF